MPPIKVVPYKGLDLDKSNYHIQPEFARFIKGLVYVITDSSQVADNTDGQAGSYRPFESNGLFDITPILPSGFNQCVGYEVVKEDSCVLFLNYNENGNHGLYKINGITQTIQLVYQKNCLNLSLEPEYFLHEGGGAIEIFEFVDPDTGEKRKRTYFVYTIGKDDQRWFCVEDAIATGGFNAATYPYFAGDYDPCLLINCGVPTPNCPSFQEVPNDNPTIPNELKFNTWQFRIQEVDVYGRPSEWGVISEMYIPGLNDCASNSDLLPRCLDLKFFIKNPLTDKVNIAFRNCNGVQWYQDTTLFLYKGSCLGDWWLRSRNPDIVFDASTKQVTYRFCKNKECTPIDAAETSRTQNPMPRESQSIAKIGKVLGFANNRDGFNPLPDEVMNKLSVAITPPSKGNSNTANIEIFVPVINPFTQTYQPVYETEDGKWVWGGRYSNSNQYVSNVYTEYKQYFGDADRKGFIGYLASAGDPPNSTVSELYYVDENTNEFVKVDDYALVYNVPYTKRYYHKFTFNGVAKARYVFRIASHLAKLTDKNFQDTSTYVFGTFPWSNKVTAFNSSSPDFGSASQSKELIVDVCNGNYSSVNDSKVLSIFDLTHPGEPGNGGSKVGAGYIYEKKDPTTDEYVFPIELLRVAANKNGNQAYVTSKFTDHNGFYFTADGRNSYYVEIFGNCGCNSYKKLASFQLGNDNALYQNSTGIQGREECSDFADKLCSRVKISGKIVDCKSGIPIPGVGVVLTRGGYAISGADGEFTIVAHRSNLEPQATRVDNLYYVPTICPFTNCKGGCLVVQQVTIVPCVTCDEVEIVVPALSVLFTSKKGLLSAGNYGVGVMAHDWLGRHDFVQTKNDFYFTLPSIPATRSYDPSSVTITINPAATFPSWVRKLSFCITQELLLADYMEWIVDNVEFIDNSGNVNNVAPTQIKIYYGSLVEYNKQNNYNTTTGWNFVVQSEPAQINYTSDYVEFYVNGDGQFFNQVIRAIVKYDQTGQYFLIDYDTALKDLKPYALMRLCRPNDCVTKDVFYELCGYVDVVNGKAVQNTVVLNAFDTYYKYRQIPIPSGTEEEPENVIRTFGFPFEHHSPSDLWGDHCKNIGRVNVRNPYECEILRLNQIALSGPLAVNGQLNYLNYFDEAQKTDFDSWNFEGITSMIWQTAIGLVICQNGQFTLGFNDNVVRVNAQGQMIVPSAADKFGKPNVQIGSNYGCLLFDKNTIRAWQGLVFFLDTREGVLVKHNYENAAVISQVNPSKGIEAGVDSWLRPKIKYVKNWNATNQNKKYFIGGIDAAAKSYLLSDFMQGSENYVNNEREIMIEKQETIMFDMYNNFWRGFAPFTPEMMAYLQSDLLNLQFFTFKNGVPYKHYTTSNAKTYNSFYGQQCGRVMRAVVVVDPFTKKRPMALMVSCVQSCYFASKVETNSNQQSRILLSHFNKAMYGWYAGFLCDLNTYGSQDNKLTDGNPLYGNWVDITFVGDPDKDSLKSDLLGVEVNLWAESTPP